MMLGGSIRVVRVLDLQLVGPDLVSLRPLVAFVYGSPKFNSLAMLVNS